MSIQYDEKQTESFPLGSSVYGGRPTFALVRNEDGNDVTLTLYELLPAEQADARHRRLERRRQRVSMTKPIEQIIDQHIIEKNDWVWADWIAVKVRQLSGARLRSVLPVIEKTFQEADIDSSDVTKTGDSTVLIYEAMGIKLSLAFLGVKPLHRVDRMRELARGISTMGLEECYYWYAKCRSPNFPNGTKALRTLLTK